MTVATLATTAAARSANLGDLEKVRLMGGGSVATAGDVNGDGQLDQLVGNPSAGEAGRKRSGAVYVVFGSAERSRTVHLDRHGDHGFAIHGGHSRDQASAAAGVGDVNGDGLDDVLVGAPLAKTSKDAPVTGAAYVVFGKPTNDWVDLREFDEGRQGLAGYRISGGSSRSMTGKDVAGAGDVNGDGLADLVVGAPFAGAAYVVFGKESATPVDLLTFDLGLQGNAGYKISTPVPASNDLFAVDGGSDLNEDGVPDTLVGILSKQSSPGSTYVVYGKADPLPVDVGALGSEQGYGITGGRRGRSAGYSVSTVEDANGDGLADVVIGAPSFECCRSAAVYVVFGQTNSEDVDLRRIGDRGYVIEGGLRGSFGLSVGSLADANGDGKEEILIGSPYDASEQGSGNGFAYVVFGDALSKDVNVRALGPRGIRIEGARKGDQAGGTIAGLGDTTADGIPELLIGCFGRSKSYIVGGAQLFKDL